MTSFFFYNSYQNPFLYDLGLEERRERLAQTGEEKEKLTYENRKILDPYSWVNDIVW